jgi:hypothetical protein
MAALAENIAAEAEAKIELLQQTLADQFSEYQQELEQVKHDKDQGLRYGNQIDLDFDQEQDELQKETSLHDATTKPKREEIEDEWVEFKAYKAAQEAGRQALTEMRELQEKSKMSKAPEKGSKSFKLPWKK